MTTISTEKPSFVCTTFSCINKMPCFRCDANYIARVPGWNLLNYCQGIWDEILPNFYSDYKKNIGRIPIKQPVVNKSIFFFSWYIIILDSIKVLFRSSIVDIALRWYSWNDGLVHFVAISTEAPILRSTQWDDSIFTDPWMVGFFLW